MNRSSGMPEQLLHANSLVEAYLYLKVRPCRICGNGTLEPQQPRVDQDQSAVRIVAACDECGGADEFHFETSAALTRGDPLSEPYDINASPRPSKLIDVAQWLTLYELLLDSAGKTPDRQEARWLQHRAGQCLDEALKFYEIGEELPSSEAFFSEETRRRFHSHPQQFARSKWLERRLRLPETISPADAVQPATKCRKWWKFWDRG